MSSSISSDALGRAGLGLVGVPTGALQRLGGGVARATWRRRWCSADAAQRSSIAPRARSAAIRSRALVSLAMVGRSAAVTSGRRPSADTSSRDEHVVGQVEQQPVRLEEPRSIRRGPPRQPHDRVDEHAPVVVVEPGHHRDVRVEVDQPVWRGGQLQEAHPPLGHLDVLDVRVVVIARADAPGRNRLPPSARPG